MKIQKGKQLDFTIEDVNNVYSGPVGVIWEMLMGEQIHVGGEKETSTQRNLKGNWRVFFSFGH